MVIKKPLSAAITLLFSIILCLSAAEQGRVKKIHHCLGKMMNSSMSHTVGFKHVLLWSTAAFFFFFQNDKNTHTQVTVAVFDIRNVCNE